MTQPGSDWDVALRAAVIVGGCLIGAVLLAVFGAGFALGRIW